MDNKETKIIDLYKGFEGEPGFFFIAKDEKGNEKALLKSWSGYVANIIYEEPHAEKDGWHGLTKLFHEDTLNESDCSLDNLYAVEDKKDFLSDLVWYKENRYQQYSKETKELLDKLTELVCLSISENLTLLVANDEE